MAMWKCAGCGIDVPQAEATAVTWTGDGGVATLAYLCPKCKEWVAGGKLSLVKMGVGGQVEAVPSVPAEAHARASVFDPTMDLSSFMGRPVFYWMELDAHAKSMRYEGFIEEIAQLKLQVQALAADKRLEFRRCPTCGFETPSMQHDVKAVGEFGYCNGGPTHNRMYVPEKMKKAYDEILANTRRADPPGAPSLVCSDERTAEAIRKVTIDAGLPLPERVPEMPPVQPPRAAGEYTCTVERQPDGRLTIRVRDPQGQAVEEYANLEDNITDAGIRERLAAYAHEAWARWMRHLYSRCTVPAGEDVILSRTIGEWDSAKWMRQMETPYADLPEDEKASDRAQADKILAILRGEK
jgi:hypothetical protein